MNAAWVLSTLQNGLAMNEKGKRAALALRAGESAYLFRLDNESSRTNLGLQRVCDGVFVHWLHGQRPKLIFVELKGTDIQHGATQLAATLRAVQRSLNERTGNRFPAKGDIRACIVRSGSAPHGQTRIQETFYRDTGVALLFARNTLDVRSLV